MQKNYLKKKDILFLTIILLVAFIFRLYKINSPLADLHSWRQADTAAVARNFVKNGFDLLHPKYDDLSNIQSGKENPQGFRMVEFPLYNATFAFLYKSFPQLPLEIWGRLTSIFFSLILIAIIYYLTLKEISRLAAVFAAITYAIFPFFVFFSRVVLPETMAITLTFSSIFFLYLSINQKNTIRYFLFFILSIISFALSLLTKPTVIFYILVIFYLFFLRYKFSFFKKIDFYLFFLFSFLPLIWWRNYIQNFPEGIPAFEWLLTSVHTSGELQSIFFRPAFFRWIFFERINNLIFGGYLTVFFILGILCKQKNYLPHFYLLSSLSYLFVFQGGNVQHEYYQTLILPSLAIFVGIGTETMVNNIKKVSKIISYSLIFILFPLAFAFSFFEIKNFYNYPKELPQIAKIISTLTNKEDKIITDTLGDTTLLYLSNRRGSPAPYKDLSLFKKDGYCCFVTLNQETITKLKEKNQYRVLFENDKLTIFAL